MAATKNSHIKELNLGIITDFGLDLLAKELLNTSLIKLAFTEDKSAPFSDKSKDAFIATLKTGIEFSDNFSLDEAGTIQKVKAKLVNDDDRIEYFCDKRKKLFKQHGKYRKRNKVLKQKNMIRTVIKQVEGKFRVVYISY